jgi:cyclopropane fatty-acyl-phospholipid synthase-like methyltransferase
MEKIGADLNLYRPYIRRHDHKIFELLASYTSLDIFKEPWLDVGSGENYMRDLMAEKTRKNIQSSEIDLDVTPYEFSDNYFLTITSFELLEHLYNPLFHLMELHRVLSPEGNLFLFTPNDYSLIYKVTHLLSRKYAPHFHQFSEKDLRDVMTRAGFKVVIVKKLRRGISGTLARISRDRLFVHAKK